MILEQRHSAFPQPNRSTLLLASAAVLLLAAALRLTGLCENPPGLFRDELDKGYTAYCLLKTGHDQSGVAWPLFVRALNVTTSALYEYLTLLCVALLGLTETAIRLPAALGGVAAVGVMMLLARKLWGEVPGIVCGVLLAFNPWHLLLSRWANQSILLTLWLPLGLLFWLQTAETRGWRRGACILGAAIAWSLALFTYAPARLFVPLFCIGLAVVEWRAAKPEDRARISLNLLGLAAALAVFALPLARHILTEPESTARLSAISVFDGRSLFDSLLTILGNYLAHFSPFFLFLGGDSNLRHSIGFPGGCHFVVVLGAILGVWRVVRRRKRGELILLLWLFLGPVAAACTDEGIPHALRAVTMLPALPLLAVAGIVEAQERWATFYRPQQPRKTPGTAMLLLGIWLASVGILFWNLWAVYPSNSAPWWETDLAALAEWRTENRDRFPLMILSGTVEYPQPAFLVYGDVEPQQWIETHTVPGVEFLPPDRPIDRIYRSANPGTAYAARPGELRQVRQDSVIRYPDGSPAWVIVGVPLQP